MNKELNYNAITKYSGIISSIANNAVGKVEGVSKDNAVVKYKFGLSTLKDRNIMVYIEGDKVILDMYVNVTFGYAVPEVVCNLQERIKSEVEENTKFKIKKINVHVANINFE